METVIPGRRGSTGLLLAALLALVVVLVALLLVGVWYSKSSGPPPLDPNAQPRPVAARGDLAADEQATIALFKRASPSVVFISTSQVRRNALTLNVMEIDRGSGSGFVWDDQGNVVTNYHVVEGVADGNGRVKVTLADHTVWDAEVVGVAPDKDLAVLRIEAPADKLRPLLVGRSADLQVGQKVFAIGNPFGLDQTLTTGVISGVGREIESLTGRPIKGVVQTDAAINPGNSGGPLLDSAGRLIGVNTAIYSPSGVYAGIGFAVPVDTVNRIVPQVLRHGRAIRPGLGVAVADDQLTRRIGLEGVLVVEVTPGSAADKAGLQPTRFDERGEVDLGDVIVAVDDQRVETTNDLYSILDSHEVGDRVVLTVVRGRRTLQVPVTLEALE